MGNAPADEYVTIDARAARKRRADDNDDDIDQVEGGRHVVRQPKRLRTSVKVKTEMPDAILVGDIDAPAAGANDRPATRTPTHAMTVEIPATPPTAGCEWSATPLDFDAPARAASLPVESEAFATPLNFDWPPTASAATTPVELHADCNAGTGPLDADDDADVDPTLVAAYEANGPHVLLDEKRLWPAPPECNLPGPLELPGTDGPVLRPYGMPAVDVAAIAPIHLQACEPDDWKPHVQRDLVSGYALDGRELSPPPQARVLADDGANIDPALWDEDYKPLATDAPLNFEATNTHTPHTNNVAQLLAPAHADALVLERTPYVPFSEKIDYITEWQRRVALDVLAPPSGPRRVLLPLPQPDDAGMPPMSPKTKRELEEFLAAYDVDVGPAFPRARVEMGLLTPDEEPGPAMDLAMLDALLLDLQMQARMTD